MSEEKSAGAFELIVPFFVVVTRAIKRQDFKSRMAFSGQTIVKVFPGVTLVAP